MVTFNTHIIDQTTKDKFHPFIAKAVTPLTPIHYEKIELKGKYIVADVIVQEMNSSWNNVSKRMLIVGKLELGELKVVEVKQINNSNYRAPIPCSDSNQNCYTKKNCQWGGIQRQPTSRKMVHPKESGLPIEDIKYERRTDELRHFDPYQ